jgi:MFS family permease
MLLTKTNTEIDLKQLKATSKQAWLVTFSGTGVNLTLGIIYSWSIIAAYLRDTQGWSAMDSQLPYMITCSVFALLMVPAGRLQDSMGPKAGLIGGLVRDWTGSYNTAFLIASALCAAGVILSLLIKEPEKRALS